MISYRKRTQILRLIGYFTAVAIAAVPVTYVIGQAWVETPYGLVAQAMLALPHLVGIGQVAPFFFLLGLFLAPPLLMLFDRYKRAQALIAWVGLAFVAAFILLPFGLLIEQLREGFSAVGGGLFLAGLALGARLCGLRLAILFEKDPDLTFPAAPRRLRQFTFLVVFVGLLESLLVYRSPLYVSGDSVAVRPPEFVGLSVDGPFVVAVVFAVLLMVGLSRFLNYESESRTVQIGPERSGKTAAFGGLFAHIDDENPGALLRNEPGVPAADDRATKIRNGEFPPPTQEGDMDILGLPYETGGLFPEEMTLQGVDYPGEALEDILQPVRQAVRSDGGRDESQANAAREGDDAAVLQGGDTDRPPAQRHDQQDADDGSGDGTGDSNAPAQRHDQQDADGADGSDTGIDAQDYGEAESWVDAIRNLREVAQSDESEAHAGSAVWNCIDHADRVILTIPFDDFIAPLAERGTLAPYRRPETKEYDPDADNTATGRDQLTNPEQFLYEEDGTVYYDEARPPRPPVEEYLRWYKDLVRERGEKEYIIAVTKADLATDDFGGLPYNDVEGFRKHVRDVMAEVDPQVSTLVEETYEDAPFALWYEINEDEPPAPDDNLTIKTGVPNGPILRGSEELLDRLEQ